VTDGWVADGWVGVAAGWQAASAISVATITAKSITLAIFMSVSL
jgi:hypothetical protein